MEMLVSTVNIVFTTLAQVFLTSFAQMQAKVLSPAEQDINNGKQDEFLAALLAHEQILEGEVQVSDHIKID